VRQRIGREYRREPGVLREDDRGQAQAARPEHGQRVAGARVQQVERVQLDGERLERRRRCVREDVGHRFEQACRMRQPLAQETVIGRQRQEALVQAQVRTARGAHGARAARDGGLDRDAPADQPLVARIVHRLHARDRLVPEDEGVRGDGGTERARMEHVEV
jgi:hypothetical protein